MKSRKTILRNGSPKSSREKKEDLLQMAPQNMGTR